MNITIIMCVLIEKNDTIKNGVINCMYSIKKSIHIHLDKKVYIYSYEYTFMRKRIHINIITYIYIYSYNIDMYTFTHECVLISLNVLL